MSGRSTAAGRDSERMARAVADQFTQLLRSVSREQMEIGDPVFEGLPGEGSK